MENKQTTPVSQSAQTSKAETITISLGDYADLFKRSPFSALEKILGAAGAYSTEISPSPLGHGEKFKTCCHGLRLEACLQNGVAKKYFERIPLSAIGDDPDDGARIIVEWIQNPISFIPLHKRQGWEILYCNVVVQTPSARLQGKRTLPILKLTP